MAIFIIRARLGLSIAGSSPTFSYPSTPYFTDATADNEFAFPWIQRMKMDNITAGCTAATYCPTDPVTRGDMAIFVMRGAFNQFLPAGTPVISQISPGVLPIGSSVTFTVTGVNTNFVQGTTVISPIPGVTVGAITVTSATSLDCAADCRLRMLWRSLILFWPLPVVSRMCCRMGWCCNSGCYPAGGGDEQKPDEPGERYGCYRYVRSRVVDCDR